MDDERARVGRNEPCPCGTGKKHKQCCGAIALQPARGAPAEPLQRECGTCTACCDGWVVATIYGHEMKPGAPCYFRGEGCCTIYDRRPHEPCRNFVCGWRVSASPFPDAFRPDRIGVIIVPIRWRARPAYILCSAGRDPDDALLDWMRHFSVGTGSPFFYARAGARFGFGPPEFQQDMAARLDRGERLW